MVLPPGLNDVPWNELEFLGWRDARSPLRGYLVSWRAERPVGVLVRAAESTMPRRTAAVCMLCRSGQSANNISLFTTRRSGPAGRKGDTVGTYICADLGCAQRVRTDIPAWLRERDPDEVVAERSAELRDKVLGFLDSVRR